MTISNLSALNRSHDFSSVEELINLWVQEEQLKIVIRDYKDIQRMAHEFEHTLKKPNLALDVSTHCEIQLMQCRVMMGRIKLNLKFKNDDEIKNLFTAKIESISKRSDGGMDIHSSYCATFPCGSKIYYTKIRQIISGVALIHTSQQKFYTLYNPTSILEGSSPQLDLVYME